MVQVILRFKCVIVNVKFHEYLQFCQKLDLLSDMLLMDLKIFVDLCTIKYLHKYEEYLDIHVLGIEEHPFADLELLN